MKVIVIGAGLAGMSAALMAHEAGHRVSIISKGVGGLLLSSGTIDVYGWTPLGKPVTDPFNEITSLEPEHPYSHIGEDNLRSGVRWLIDRCSVFDSGADVETNTLIPTAVGAVRPTAAVQETMVGLENGQKLVVVGIKQFKDFPAGLIADNLSRSPLVDVEARDVTIDVTMREPEVDSTGTTAARALDSHARELVDALRGVATDGEIILLPAILGYDKTTYEAIAGELGVRIGEVPVPPPSIPGRRINDDLLSQLKAARIDIAYNAQVAGFDRESDTISTLHVQRAGRTTIEKVDAVIYAGGGFESGSLHRYPDGNITERLFNLPVVATEDIFDSGIRIDGSMRPVDGGAPIFTNLHLAGSIIGGARPYDEKSGEGIALGSAAASVAALGAIYSTTEEVAR